MPDEQATRSAARCDTHPGTASIAVCDSCGRSLCLRCAVPVRGRVFGRECLAEVLGPGEAPVQEAAPPRPRNRLLLLTVAGFLVAATGSLLPWTYFGVASGVFGAWGFSPPRWSALAAMMGFVGLVLATVLVARERFLNVVLEVVLFTLAAGAALGSVLHLLNPPPFTHAWAGPWVSLGGSVIAAAASSGLFLRHRSER
jgi:hypothetical protein